MSVANHHSRAAVVVIGDYRGECPSPKPRNLFFLGLKAQRDLPPYLANANVGIVPFIPSTLTDAVSPLKVFEYVSMGLPVVATRLNEIENLPYVRIAHSAGEFNAHVDSARRETVDPKVIEDFRDQHSWKARVRELLTIVEEPLPQ